MWTAYQCRVRFWLERDGMRLLGARATVICRYDRRRGRWSPFSLTRKCPFLQDKFGNEHFLYISLQTCITFLVEKVFMMLNCGTGLGVTKESICFGIKGCFWTKARDEVRLGLHLRGETQWQALNSFKEWSECITVPSYQNTPVWTLVQELDFLGWYLIVDNVQWLCNKLRLD